MHSSWDSATSIIFIVLHALYSIDILISFRVAYTENEMLITDKAAVARNYRRCSPMLPSMYDTYWFRLRQCHSWPATQHSSKSLLK